MVGLPPVTIQVWVAAPPLDQLWNWYRRPFSCCCGRGHQLPLHAHHRQERGRPDAVAAVHVHVSPGGLVVTVTSVLLGKMSRKTVW